MTDNAPFALDTSGVVHFGGDVWKAACHFRWPDLTSFEQGYVEAMLRGPIESALKSLAGMMVGFSDLAPETLAAIRKDCAEHASLFPDLSTTATLGGQFWKRRQCGQCNVWGSPPLTLTLGDDGKVYARASA